MLVIWSYTLYTWRERSCAMRGRSSAMRWNTGAFFRQMCCYVLRVMSCVGGLPLCSGWCDRSQVKMTKRETAHKWKERSGRPLTLCCTCFDQAGDRSQPKMTKRETARTDNWPLLGVTLQIAASLTWDAKAGDRSHAQMFWQQVAAHIPYCYQRETAHPPHRFRRC